MQRLVAPKSNNALFFYRQVLLLEPGHPDAQQGITKITNKLLAQTRSAIKNGKIENLQKAVDHIALIDPENNKLPKLRRSLISLRDQKIKAEELRIVEKKHQQQIKNYLSFAAAAIKENRYTSVDGRNALAYYLSVLNLQPDNSAARDGIVTIGNHYLDLVNQALLDDNLNDAENYLKTAETINPGDSSINLLQEQIRMRRQVHAMQEKRMQVETVESAIAAQEAAIAKALAEQQSVHEAAVTKVLAEQQVAHEKEIIRTAQDKNSQAEEATAKVLAAQEAAVTKALAEQQESHRAAVAKALAEQTDCT